MKSKRLISILLCLSILVSLVVISTTSTVVSAGEKHLIGDADLDGEISIIDATAIQRDLANLNKLSDLGRLVAITTGDTEISTVDAVNIQKYLASLPNHGNTGNTYGEDPTESTEPTETTEEPTEEPTIDPDVPLADTVNDGTILQAFCWSFQTIRNYLPDIKAAGFTTVQVSPPNEIKEGTKGNYFLQDDDKNGWWMFYQPAGFQLNESTDNAMGTKSEFVAMCNEAHQLGVKIIVDSVINHMGTCDNEKDKSSTNPMDHLTPKAQQFEPEIYNNKLFHSPWVQMTYNEDPSRFSEYESTLDLTQHCTSRLPDLNTQDSRVQTAIYDYLDELIASGADGFRFDAAKHIETSEDPAGLRSDFWKNTLQKVQTKYAGQVECYAYGEILNTCGAYRPFSRYTKLMDVTDSSSIWAISNAIRGEGGNATPSLPNDNFTKENCILWDESHDTYVDGSTTYYSVDVRNRIWAISAGRADITCVYLARPDDSTSTNAMKSIKLGEGKKTSWSNNITAEINKFHNRHIGDGEYCTSNQSNRAYIERGDSGCVIVGLGSTKSGSVSLANHKLKKGTYIDQITGNTFEVTKSNGGQIKGSVGSSGIAIIEFLKDDPSPTTPTDDPGPEKPYPTSPGCYTVVISNSMGWDQFYAYCWEGENRNADWPGEPMTWCKTNEFGENQYCYFVPYEMSNFIVNNGRNDDDPEWKQTDDAVITGDTGIYLGELQGNGRYKLEFWNIEDY